MTLIKNLFHADWADSAIDLLDPGAFIANATLLALVNVLESEGAARYLELRAVLNSLTPTDDFTTDPTVRVYGFFETDAAADKVGAARSVSGYWAPLYRRDTGAFQHTFSFTTVAWHDSTYSATSDILIDLAGAKKVVVLLDADATQPSIDSGESASLALSIEGRLLDA